MSLISFLCCRWNPILQASDTLSRRANLYDPRDSYVACEILQASNTVVTGEIQSFEPVTRCCGGKTSTIPVTPTVCVKTFKPATPLSQANLYNPCNSFTAGKIQQSLQLHHHGQNPTIPIVTGEPLQSPWLLCRGQNPTIIVTPLSQSKSYDHCDAIVTGKILKPPQFHRHGQNPTITTSP